MSKKSAGLAKSDVQLVSIGSQHSSEDVFAEAAEARERWTRDQARLAVYGHGPNVLARFLSLCEEHARLRAARPQVVAFKKASVEGRDAAYARAWQWVERVGSILIVLARGDHDLAIKLEEALPDTDGELDAGIGALAELLAAVSAGLPADAEAAARLSEVPTLRSSLAATLGTVGDAKARRVIDTAAIDLLDGKIYIAIRDLNEAGRRAIRNGDLQGTLADYRFHRLNHRRRPADEEPEPTAPAQPSTPVVPSTPA